MRSTDILVLQKAEFTAKFKSIRTRDTWVTEPTAKHNTICNGDCHINCHESCGLRFSDWETIGHKCSAFGKGKLKKCKKCGHPAEQHHHSHQLWRKKTINEDETNVGLQNQHIQAKYNLETTEGRRRALEGEKTRLEVLQQSDIHELGTICEQFSKIAISGSFSGFIASKIAALKAEQEVMKKNGAAQEAFAGIGKSLEMLTRQLKIIKEAEEARKNKAGYGGGT
jgi:hypothetical protein